MLLLTRFACDGSFTVHFFLGDFQYDESSWANSGTLVGVSGIFASSRERIDGGNCDNCATQEAEGDKYHDLVPLTQALLTYFNRGQEAYGYRVTDLSPEVVVPFLTRNLHWRIVNVSRVSFFIRHLQNSERVTLTSFFFSRPPASVCIARTSRR